jgi:tetraacyldisaccharide 4'-kinase
MKFFYQKSTISFLLLPFSLIYLAIFLIRNFLIKQEKLANKVVICIGNASVGGAGKTPTAILVAKILQEKGLKTCFLSRGYGRKSKGFLKLNEAMDKGKTGDEPRLLLKIAPVYLFSSYKEVLKNQSSIAENIIIMDDGFQNPSIHKDFTILVVDGKLKFGNGFLLPAGPLREPVFRAVSRANIVFNVEGEGAVQSARQEFKIKRNYVLECEKASYLAFSGLAINQKFFDSLEKLGLKILQKIEFKDHHDYSEEELTEILEKSRKINCTPITTEKDFVKIPQHLQPFFAKLEMTFSLENQEELTNQLKKFKIL